MGDRRYGALAVLLAAGIALAGCGDLSEESKDELSSALENLRSISRETQLILNGLEEEKESDQAVDSDKEALDEEQVRNKLELLSLKEEELKAFSSSVMEDDTVKQILEEIDALKEEYADLTGQIVGEKDRREENRAESAKHIRMTIHLRNLSGSDISGICIREGNKDGKELLPEGMTVQDGETILGLVAELYLPKNDRSLILTDSEGNVHEYTFTPDLLTDHPDGLRITVKGDGTELEYDSNG